MRPPFRSRRALALGVAWSAAVAFAVSLGSFGYFYGVVLGVPASARPTIQASWLTVLRNVAWFSLFALHHSLLARTGVKRRLARWIPASLERATYIWVASLLLILVCLTWTRLDGEVWRCAGLVAWTGLGVQGVGAFLLLRAGGRIDLSELTGIRQVAAGVGPATPPRLEVDGPYRLVRHPLYLGVILLAWAIPTMTLDRLVLAAALTVYIVIAIPWEERTLTAEFGDAYRRYVEGVRWRVIPGLY